MAEGQYVVFKLSGERFCVDITAVSGIAEYQNITNAPNSPEYIKGIINLRGDIVPVVNLKKRFNLPETELTSETRIINISFAGKDVGFLVDAASDVQHILDENIEEVPEILKKKDNEYISGVAKVDGKIVIVLDLTKIFNEEETEKVLQLKNED